MQQSPDRAIIGQVLLVSIFYILSLLGLPMDHLFPFPDTTTSPWVTHKWFATIIVTSALQKIVQNYFA